MAALGRWSTVVVLTLGMCGVAAADVAEILKAHFRAVGGLDRMSEVQTVRRSGTAQLHAQFGDLPGTFEEAAVVGKKSYSKTDFGGFTEATVWDGVEGWKTASATGTTALEGMQVEGAKAAAFLDPMQGIYEQDAGVFEQREDATFEDIECSVVGIAGVEVEYYIDKASDLLVGAKLGYVDPTSGPVALVIQYFDHEEYGGVMFPESRKIVIGDGAMTIEYAYAKTEIDVELDETVFERP
ncbi:hypothetical protein HN371_22525 [Candidatus Poribacteria bacterium]|nr:hypothetical protein [Candidatus Poribacteria bacterium]MBT5536861.1 hypothetical protein [Candidatus Poribacteria bacterium]MBT5713293.1 hypothetical protein [Candidatus Poribacteria bacterium]MBT7098577.1 hypothetical protein [Candidatus Poribacteria bacterium]MBT7804295.1 hypothetical protein [Candidatus Poribacteria bacterium]